MFASGPHPKPSPERAMSALTTPLPCRRPELLVRPLGEDGRHVVKDPRTGEYLQLGAQEHFLLHELDGRHDGATVCAAFEARFGQPLSADDLGEFVELARVQGWVQDASGVASAPRSPKRQSILYWRKALFDPDRFFTWLEPKTRFFWSRPFLLASVGCILFAAVLVGTNPAGLAASFRHALRWETAVLAWLTLLVVTTLHEFAHGLTCKRHGGEVHEIGFLLLF